MPRYKMIAITRPQEGREDDYNAWYQNTHLVEVCALPGVVSARRYKLQAGLSGHNPGDYMALYDIECDDIGATLAALGQAIKSGSMTMTDAMDGSGAYTAVFTEFGEPVLA